MATFPDISPDYGAQKTSKPNVRTVRFSDGYEQRLTFGLNQNPKVWNLSFVNLTETDSDTIETFLDARASDNESFDWQPPGESTTYKWVCEQWSKSIPYANRATIQATFREVFEP
jgi:phage-related protein